MKTREEVQLTLLAKLSDYKNVVNKLSLEDRKKVKLPIPQLEACIRDLENGLAFEVKDGFVSTPSAKIKL